MPTRSIRCNPVLLCAVATFAGCAGTAPPATVPAALRPPAGQALVLQAAAKGVQVYECRASAGQPGAAAWVFVAPEAELSDSAGHLVAKHYAGPTWESIDGSKVVGSVVAQDPGPNAGAIPWLLLASKSHAGQGVFSQVTSVQRLDTVGGVAPSGGCGAANVGATARTPYTAVYRFYKA